MPDKTNDLLHCCLYFTAGSLARVVTRLAEEEFKLTGLAPNQAFLLMLVVAEPGSRQKDLGADLQLAPSTVTRMVESLARAGLIERHEQGRESLVQPTAKGVELLPALETAWARLRQRYVAVLGPEVGDDLTRRVDGAARALLESRDNR